MQPKNSQLYKISCADITMLGSQWNWPASFPYLYSNGNSNIYVNKDPNKYFQLKFVLDEIIPVLLKNNCLNRFEFWIKSMAFIKSSPYPTTLYLPFAISGRGGDQNKLS